MRLQIFPSKNQKSAKQRLPPRLLRFLRHLSENVKLARLPAQACKRRVFFGEEVERTVVFEHDTVVKHENLVVVDDGPKAVCLRKRGPRSETVPVGSDCTASTYEQCRESSHQSSHREWSAECAHP